MSYKEQELKQKAKKVREDQQKAFDKFSIAQRYNALHFGSLSDKHVFVLRTFKHDESKMFRLQQFKKFLSNPVWRRVLQDIFDCADYTGRKPHAYDQFKIKQVEYKKWQKDRIKTKDQDDLLLDEVLNR